MSCATWGSNSDLQIVKSSDLLYIMFDLHFLSYYVFDLHFLCYYVLYFFFLFILNIYSGFSKMLGGFL